VTRLFVVVMREEEGLIMDGFTMDGRNSAAKSEIASTAFGRK
jgi:hypothetical protein